MIVVAKNDGKLKGFKISTSLFLTHILFVDDVVLVGRGIVGEWFSFVDIITLFYDATSMEVSSTNSCFPNNNINENMLAHITSIFPYKVDDIDGGIKYLGYYLKPSSYRVNDWMWFVKKVEKRIGIWYYKLLTLGGRITLLIFMLVGILLYWVSLEKMSL